MIPPVDFNDSPRNLQNLFGDFPALFDDTAGYYKLSYGPQLFLILRAVQQAVVDLSTKISQRCSLRQQDAWMIMNGNVSHKSKSKPLSNVCM